MFEKKNKNFIYHEIHVLRKKTVSKPFERILDIRGFVVDVCNNFKKPFRSIGCDLYLPVAMPFLRSFSIT